MEGWDVRQRLMAHCSAAAESSRAAKIRGVVVNEDIGLSSYEVSMP